MAATEIRYTTEGTRHKAFARVDCWKDHTCIECGSVYGYPLCFEWTAVGATHDEAKRKARAWIEETLAESVEYAPCPVCGRIQPDMESEYRRKWHKNVQTFFVVTLAVGFFAVFGLELSYGAGACAMAAGVGLFACFHLAGAFHDPNRNRPANRQKAEGMIARGDLALREKGTKQKPSIDGGHFAPRRRLVAALFGIACLACLSSELLRIGVGWPRNGDWCPEVVGPGDTPYMHMGRLISVKGHWSGEAQAVTLDADGRANEILKATTHQESWGDKIQVGNVTTNGVANLWMRVEVPHRPELVRQSVPLRLRLVVAYPRSHDKGFVNNETVVDEAATLHLASPLAGTLYRAAWFVGIAIGFGLSALCGFSLLRSATDRKHLALPTTCAGNLPASAATTTAIQTRQAVAPIAAPLGPLTEQPYAEYAVNPFVLPGVLAVAALFLALGGWIFYDMVLAPREPGMNDVSTVGLICGMIPILMAVFLAWKVTSQQGQTVRACPGGLIYRHVGKDLEFPWDQIVSVWTSATAYSINFAPVGTFTKMTIERDDGAKAVLVSDLQNATELFQTILTKTREHLFPLQWKRFINGEKISFGALSLSRVGIHVGADTLPWADCTDFSTFDGKLILRRKDGLLAWQKLPVSTISNYHVMVALMEEYAQHLREND